MLLEIIRHGATAWQAEHRYQGRRSDVALSAAGRAALAQADWVPACVYVTPLVRTAQTAAAVFPGAPQVAVPGLEEMDFGAFEYMTWQEIDRDPDPAHRLAYQHYIDSGGESAFPGGEAKADFTARVCRGFEEKVLPRLRALQHGAPPGEVVILAHGGTLMALMEQYALPHRSYFDWHIAPGESIRTKLVFSSAGAVELRWSENPTQNICYE